MYTVGRYTHNRYIGVLYIIKTPLHTLYYSILYIRMN